MVERCLCSQSPQTAFLGWNGSDLGGLRLYAGGARISLHPFEGEYFNEAFRMAYRKNIQMSFEFPDWGLTSYREAVEWLNAHATAHASIRVPTLIVNLYPQRSDLVFKDTDPCDYTVIA